jgi:hypothetical protein
MSGFLIFGFISHFSTDEIDEGDASRTAHGFSGGTHARYGWFDLQSCGGTRKGTTLDAALAILSSDLLVSIPMGAIVVVVRS